MKISLFCQEKISLFRKFYLKMKRCQEKKGTSFKKKGTSYCHHQV